MKRRILSCLLALIMTLSLLPMNVLAAGNWVTTKPSGSVVSVYGTTTTYGQEKNAIKSGPLYGSKWYQQVSPKANTNNQSYRIPPVSELFTLNDGWKLKYVSVAGNSSGTRQPGENILLSSSGASLVYYFEKKAPAQTTYSLIYDKNTTDTVTNMPDNQTTTVAADGVQFTVSPLIPVREGYTFKGWQTSDGTKVGPKVGVTKEHPSITIYAIWEQNETPPIDPPKPSGEPNFADVNGQIRVQCTAYPSNHEPHAYQYDITDGSYTKEGLSSDGFTYSIILDRASFIKKFDADTGRTHKDEEPNEVARVTWRWDVNANNEGKWKLISGPDGITADIKCICEATPVYPPIPGKDENTIGGSGFDFECVTEDAAHNKRLQMTLRDHPEAYTVGTEIKTKTDPRGGERAYFEVTVTDVAVYLPTYNYFYGNHKICDGQPNTLTLTFWLLDSGRWGQWGSRTVDPYVKVECVKIPDAPTADEVKAALGNVTVHCINPTTDTQNCTDTVYSAAGGNSVGEAVKVSDTQYTVSIGAAAFANAFGGTRKHNLYSAETLTWVLNYEDGKWVGRPKEAGVDDTILVTHAPEKYQEVSKMGYDLDGNPTGIKATCTTSGHGPITYGLSTAFAYYGTDVESVAYDAESKGYIATLKVTHYVESIGTGCNKERAKANLDARDHKLTSDETVQWKLYPTGYDKESGKYVWASMPVADKDAAITVSHKLAVTFMPKNGKSDFVNLVYEGETVAEEPVVTRDGYKFLGWYLGEEKFDFTTPITEDITLVAKWEEDKQVVNVVIYRNGDFDKSYDTVSLGKMAKGTIIDLTKLDIDDYYTGTSEGYEFHGWYNDGAWNEYKKNPDRAGLSEVTVNGWTNLKCMVYDYEAIVVKAVYDNDKDNAEELFRGKALHGSNVLGYLASQDIELDKDGYTHDQWFNWDWYTAWEGDANRIGEKTTVNGWTNVYVKYNTIYLDVTFDLNGGNVGGDTSNVVVPVAWGSTVTKPTTPSKSGYTFAGWYTEDHKVFDFNTAIYDNLTLTAAWAPAKAAAFVENFLTIDCVGCNLGSKLGHAHGAKTYEFLDRAFSVNKDTFQWNEELGTYTVELYNKSLKLNPYLDSIANWVGFEKDPGEGLPHQMVGGDRNFYLLCAQDENGQWKAVGYADWKQGGKHDAFTMMPNGVKIDVECGTPELPTLVTDSNMIWTRDETNTRNYLKTSVLDGTWTVLNDTFKRDEKTGTFYVTIQVAKDQLTKYIDNAAASKKWGDGYLLNEEKTENENATPFQFVMKFNLDTKKDASEAYNSTYVKRNKTYSNWSWDKSTVSGSVKNNGYTVWATKEYNVTFETDGGKPVPAPQVVRWGKYATKPTEIPVKGDSWVFNGWYTDETGAVEFDFDKTAIKANTTIYAGYDSVYEIHYFKQLVDGSYEEDTASFVRGFAKEGTMINAPEKNYGTHFLLNAEKSNMSGPVIKATVDKEGKVNCLVLNVYYDRDMHTVTFDTQDGTKIDPVEVRCGNPVAQPITPSKAGYYFSGWFLNGSKYSFSTPVTSDITITAEFTKYAPVNPVPPTVEAKDLAFNTTDHFAYVNGYPDGTVQPEGNITRAEVAAILYRVMDAKCVEKYATDKNTFADVDAFKWYNTYISTLANAGVIVDSANGYFRPNEAITRAELAAMIAQFAKVDLTKSVSFNDVLANHWASKEIAIAAKMGWINGYPDGSFRPDATITRAEMITMINRALNRVPSAEDHLLAGMVTFPDCQSGQWYYLAVQEATNGHTYNRVGTAGDERWIALIK